MALLPQRGHSWLDAGHAACLCQVAGRDRLEPMAGGLGSRRDRGTVNGIPVLASHIGGLPESVGSGGILFDPSADAAAWAAAVERLFADFNFYQAMARQARDRAARSDIVADTLVTRLLTAVRSIPASANC